MDRREFVAACAALSPFLAGCVIDRPTATTVAPPTVTAEDYAVDDPYTTFEIEWDVAAATEFDIDSGDGISTTADSESVYLFVLVSVNNVGDRDHRFFPDGLHVDVDGTEYAPAWLRHISSPFPTRGEIKTGDTLGGWMPYEVPRGLTSATVKVASGKYVDEPAVTFERNTSLSPPF